ncbi:hypothetical protein Fot_38394 [Forsythia ovata]|uniref:Uncharacterized protein n=1 Tax=Forsythia ovata TaxID=205694 RepID=A0ABD1S1R1_9LAMI
MEELLVDGMPASLQSDLQGTKAFGAFSHSQTVTPFTSVIDIQKNEEQMHGEGDYLIQATECHRICKEGRLFVLKNEIIISRFAVFNDLYSLHRSGEKSSHAKEEEEEENPEEEKKDGNPIKKEE